MRAIVLETHGGPEVLQLRDVPDPEPGPEEVLVAVVATALNRADLLQRRGFYPGPPMAHEIPGLEFAGRVVACGERVQVWREGAEVMGVVGGGGYAEKIAVHERQVVRVPDGVSVADAAAIPEVFITAFDALVAQGGLTSGRTALVHAGGSGVGTAAVQIAKAIGASVVATASAAKLAPVLELGADAAVDYRTTDWVEEALRVSRGRGVDVVLDVIGGEYADRNIEAATVGGRIIQVGVMAGGATNVNLGRLLAKRVAIIGTTLRPRPIEEKIAITQRFAREMLPLFDDGRLRPVIDSRFALARVAEAHERMEENTNVGKIILDVS
jgi:NADPH2:quinone reductase